MVQIGLQQCRRKRLPVGSVPNHLSVDLEVESTSAERRVARQRLPQCNAKPTHPEDDSDDRADCGARANVSPAVREDEGGRGRKGATSPLGDPSRHGSGGLTWATKPPPRLRIIAADPASPRGADSRGGGCRPRSRTREPGDEPSRAAHEREAGEHGHRQVHRQNQAVVVVVGHEYDHRGEVDGDERARGPRAAYGRAPRTRSRRRRGGSVRSDQARPRCGSLRVPPRSRA